MTQHIYGAQVTEIQTAIKNGNMLLVAELAIGFSAEYADQSKIPIYNQLFLLLEQLSKTD